MQYRTDRFQTIMEKQFQLAYFAKVDFVSTDDMDIGEMETLYNLFVDQKRLEKEARDKAIQEAEAKRKSARTSSWRRH